MSANALTYSSQFSQGIPLCRSVNVPEKLVTILKERFPEPAHQPLLVHLSTDNVRPFEKPALFILLGCFVTSILTPVLSQPFHSTQNKVISSSAVQCAEKICTSNLTCISVLLRRGATPLAWVRAMPWAADKQVTLSRCMMGPRPAGKRTMPVSL